MDASDTECMIKLQLDDITNFQDRCKRKEEDEKTDAEYSFELYCAELQALEQCLYDHRMGESISRAVELDSNVIIRTRIEEDNAVRDRELACNIGGVATPGKPAYEDFATIARDEELLQKFAKLNASFGRKTKPNNDTASSSKSTPGRGTPQKASLQYECAACGDRHFEFDTVQPPCGHYYCRECIAGLFETACVDESLFPPRCCRQEIPVDDIEPLVEPALVSKFCDKSIEFSTKNRTYCHNPGCSSFIPPDHIVGDIGTCTTCLARTCTTCKGEEHIGRDCPNDPLLHQVLDVARENGWQRCFGCRRLVELDIGCNHISCPCGVQFCYICGTRWRECTCPQWNEEFLISRAQHVHQRQLRDIDAEMAPTVENEAQAVRQIAQNLRERHECEHQAWRYVSGPHRCEECYFNLPTFIFECQRCRIQVCRRCRYNRL